MMRHVGQHRPEQHDHERLRDGDEHERPARPCRADDGQEEQPRGREQQDRAPQAGKAQQAALREHPPQHAQRHRDLGPVVRGRHHPERRVVGLDGHALDHADDQAVRRYAEQDLPRDGRGVLVVEHPRLALCRRLPALRAARQRGRDERQRHEHDGRRNGRQQIDGHLERGAHGHGAEDARDGLANVELRVERRPLQVQPCHADARRHRGRRGAGGPRQGQRHHQQQGRSRLQRGQRPIQLGRHALRLALPGQQHHRQHERRQRDVQRDADDHAAEVEPRAVRHAVYPNMRCADAQVRHVEMPQHVRQTHAFLCPILRHGPSSCVDPRPAFHPAILYADLAARQKKQGRKRKTGAALATPVGLPEPALSR